MGARTYTSVGFKRILYYRLTGKRTNNSLGVGVIVPRWA